MQRWLAAAALLSCAGPVLANPLADALSADGGTICFTRTYDDAWLKAHPGQGVREVRFAITFDESAPSWPTMRVMMLGAGKPMYLFGGCQWMEGDLNRGVQNDILDPGFKPTTGVACHMMTDVTGASAEEGGDFPVEWGGGKYIQAHLPDYVAAWRSTDVNRNADFFDLPAADRIVRLNRAAAADCRELVTAFAPGEPR